MRERTLVLIKPDAVAHHDVGAILQMYEQKGLHILAMRMLQMNEALAAKHYAEHVGKSFYKNLVAFMTSGPLIALVLEGENAIQVVRDLNGKTDPHEAAEGTIRRRFASSKQMNAVHGSDSPESAAREVYVFFSEAEIFDEI